MKRIKLVLDTNTVISAWIWTGNESLIVERLEEGLFQGFTSPDIIQELNRALHYPKLKLTDEDIYAAGSYISLLLKIVQPSKSVQVIKEDPDDNKFIECALEAGADFIVSGDRHLLKLGIFEAFVLCVQRTYLPLDKFKQIGGRKKRREEITFWPVSRRVSRLV